ncbi:hypothetical protein SAMN02746093_01118 [Legionella quinlivanii DSM 21216]|nr:hypothetical protein SAMN02746093_01118 [Legionella quinlivanii DSM 21216]STY09724.1 Uncharacterised protein [Legionella quinlivanii]
MRGSLRLYAGYPGNASDWQKHLKLTTIVMDTPHKAGYVGSYRGHVGSYRMVKFCDHLSGTSRGT